MPGVLEIPGQSEGLWSWESANLFVLTTMQTHSRRGHSHEHGVVTLPDVLSAWDNYTDNYPCQRYTLREPLLSRTHLLEL